MRRLAAAITLIAAMALPCTAFASGSAQSSSQQQANQANPGSPAGQEYVIPIAAARREAAGVTAGGSGGAGGAGGSAAAGGSGSGSGSAPLFGVGVTPSSGVGAAGQAASRRSPKTRAGGHARGAKHRSTATPAAADRPVSLASVTRPGSAGGDGWLALVGGGLLVLVVGGGAGIAMRRRLTGS